MKKLLLIALLVVGCGTHTIIRTHQDLSLAVKIRAGMTTKEVLEIMGEPILSELDRTIEEWHYCDTAEPNIGEIQDTFVALFFVNNKLIAKKYYMARVVDVQRFGTCENFVKMGNYEIPIEIKSMLLDSTVSPKSRTAEPFFPKNSNLFHFFTKKRKNRIFSKSFFPNFRHLFDVVWDHPDVLF